MGIGVGAGMGIGVGVGVGAGLTTAAGDESGFCGNACNPASGLEGDGEAGACARSGHAVDTARHPIARKRFFTRINLLVGILVQKIANIAAVTECTFWQSVRMEK